MILVEYKKALMRFTPVETFSAGVELYGHEVKSLRNKHGSLDGSKVVVRGGEAYIVGMSIPQYQQTNTQKIYDPARNRRLLLHKKEINRLANEESKKGLTLIPLNVNLSRGLVKIQVAIVRGKGKSDHREDIKKRESSIEMERILKNKKLWG